jgi:hypothetical protein
MSPRISLAREARLAAGLLISLASLLPSSSQAAVVAPEPMVVPPPAGAEPLATVQSLTVAGLFGDRVDVAITVDAWVERGRERIPVSAGMRLRTDDRLVTRGAAVGLLLPDGGSTLVDPGSLAVLHDMTDPAVTPFGPDVGLPASRLRVAVSSLDPVEAPVALASRP